ncbi:hypothetical protein SBX64_07890 [Vibrio rhizosphaerae]|uniref:Uncharacterized protein n=1 Tax=Vibrio rhizosphaerae TaxID=398736 RepID=A0ABU4IVZ7_9VIBR|nr:hypothetical protein [Vibrio rhizosphaerae]MDW6092464.1 hypothetical protein [Vibrio rhizosphaerae]
MKFLNNKLYISKEVTLDVDDYVPLFLNFCDEANEQVFFRYVTDICLLEIGFNTVNGCLCSIKIVQSSEIVHCSMLEQLFLTNSVDGLIGCDLSLWKNKKILDCDYSFSLFIDGCSLIVKLSEFPADKIIRNKNIYFGCSNNDLCWIVVSKLSLSELNKVNEVISKQQNHVFL